MVYRHPPLLREFSNFPKPFSKTVQKAKQLLTKAFEMRETECIFRQRRGAKNNFEAFRT